MTHSPFYKMIPNILSLFRVILIPFFLIFYFYDQHKLLIVVFLLASISDFFDGYLARKWNVCSAFGAFIDPVADKLLVCSALILIQDFYQNSLILVCNLMIILRELAMSSLRHWASVELKCDDIPVSFIGKCKTALQLISIILLLLSFHLPQAFFPGLVVLTIAAIASTVSFIHYLTVLFKFKSF